MRKDFKVDPRKDQPQEGNPEAIVQPLDDPVDPVIKKDDKFSELKQVKIADVLTGKGGHSESSGPAVAGRVYGNYGGTVTNVSTDGSTDASGRGNSRGDEHTRVGRRLDASTRAINDVASERVIVSVKGATPLHESPDSVQGAIPRRLNDNYQISKNAGLTPASPIYQRSLDEIRRDELFYLDGQVVTKEADGATTVGNQFGGKKNYINHSLQVKITQAGVVKDFIIGSEDITAAGKNANLVDAAAKNYVTHNNMIEVTRREMDVKAGDESKPGFSPLPNAISNPNSVLSTYFDFEADVGTHLYAANRFAKLSHAYQVNRASKDGDNIILPLLESFVSGNFSGVDSDAFGVSNYPDGSGVTLPSSAADLFTQNHVLKTPAWLIAMSDSTTKYKTKGDFLNLPRSFKMHIEAGNNHINNFRVDPKVKKAIENTTVFSTLDGDYDGIRPVMITDKVKITSSTPWSAFSVTGNATPNMTVHEIYTSMDDVVVEVADLRQNYEYNLAHPLIVGLMAWFHTNAKSIVDVSKKSSGDVVIDIPIVYSTTGFSTWQILLNAAAKDIAAARVLVNRLLLEYSENHGYPFPLDSFDSKDTTDSKNFNYQGIGEPIRIGKMEEHVLATWLMPELFHKVDEAGTLDAKMIATAPWYTSFESYAKGNYNYRDRYMSWPNMRSGITHPGLVLLHKLGERAVRLSFDILVEVPNARTAFGRYTSDEVMAGNLVVQVEGLKMSNYLRAARELGIKAVLPHGHMFIDTTFANANWTGEYSYTAKIYSNQFVQSAGDVDATSITLSKGSAYRQVWHYRDTVSTVSQGKGNNFVLSLSEMLQAPNNAGTTVNIQSGVATKDFLIGSFISGNDKTLVDLSPYFWTRIQILPFGINPFDAAKQTTGAGEDSYKWDPMSFLTMFGFAGFDISDFTADQYNRLDYELSMGYAYTQDPWLNDTSLLK